MNQIDINETTSSAFCMDCVDGMKHIQANSIDLTVTSPPYDNLRDYRGYIFDYKETLEEIYRVTKVGGGVRVDSFRPNKERKRDWYIFHACVICEKHRI